MSTFIAFLAFIASPCRAALVIVLVFVLGLELGMISILVDEVKDVGGVGGCGRRGFIPWLDNLNLRLSSWGSLLHRRLGDRRVAPA